MRALRAVNGSGGIFALGNWESKQISSFESLAAEAGPPKPMSGPRGHVWGEEEGGGGDGSGSGGGGSGGGGGGGGEGTGASRGGGGGGGGEGAPRGGGGVGGRAFKITRDAGGVPGLLLAENVFTEEAERHYFEMTSDETTPEFPRLGSHHGPPFPEQFHHVLNAVRDCGLLPELMDPDYCLALTYSPKATFQVHYDSRYRWGETVVGVNLGASCIIRFQPDKNLARASAYASAQHAPPSNARAPAPALS